MFRSLPVLICCRVFLCVGRSRSPLAGQSGVFILRDKHWRGSVISMLDVCAGKSQRQEEEEVNASSSEVVSSCPVQPGESNEVFLCVCVHFV